MTISGVSICAEAGLRLGDTPIQAFDEDSDSARIFAACYPTTKNFILSLYDWKFTIKKRQLARQETAPLTSFPYQYTLPSDSLTDGVIALYNTDAEGAGTYTNFEVNKDGVLTDAEEVWIDYQANNTNEENWPPYFVELITQAVMVAACFSLTENATLREGLKEEVYGNKVEYPNGGMVRACRNRNSNEDPPAAIADFTLIDARFSGV